MAHWWKIALALILPTGFLNAFTSFDGRLWLWRFVFVLLVILFAALVQITNQKQRGSNNWLSLATFGLFVITGLATLFSDSVFLAWAFLISFYVSLLNIASMIQPLKKRLRIPVWLAFSFSAGFLPVGLNQIRQKFSEEEFYVILIGLILSVFWGILLLLNQWILHCVRASQQEISKTASQPKATTWLLMLFVVNILVLFAGISSYQRSFFPETVQELYPGISSSSPFLCGEIEPPPSSTNTAQQVQQEFVALLAQKENFSINDYALLAIIQRDQKIAEFYQAKLLEAALNGDYTQPANSVKFDQFYASQTIYYYVEMLKTFPDLFTTEDQEKVRSWFSAINKRAQTIEWVDWLYALAFSHPPVGAYLNQEIGAGLYSQLLVNGFSLPSLQGENQKFMEAVPRGWESGFRVVDDALAYQPVWITNAYLQSGYQEHVNLTNLRLSFDWLLIQSLPDAAEIGYNMPGKTSLAPISLLGARLLGDGRLLWLGERALGSLSDNRYLYAQTGTELLLPADLETTAPNIGSCLIYGNSGLPELTGPLAPDKLVFRAGWESDDLYLLQNLRFTGWHRYKSTNAISMIYAGGVFSEEQHDLEKISWLPVGRAQVRDKRIPIEQLNTFLIPRYGLDRVLNELVDWFGPYSQDPPYYAAVEHFSTSPEMDFSKTTVADWHGWDFTRSIYFYKDGPTFILDEANTDRKDQAEIRWHLAEGGRITGEKEFLNEELQMKMVLLGQAGGQVVSEEENGGIQLRYLSPKTGKLQLMMVLLPREWSQAVVVEYRQENGYFIVVVELDGNELEYRLSQTSVEI